MDLYQQYFATAAELVKYVNDNTIAQANIANITTRDGGWYLFWWA